MNAAVVESLDADAEELPNTSCCTFQFCQRMWLFAENTITAADDLPFPKIDEGEIEIYSVEEMRALLKAAGTSD